jgi:hypothetical protein
LKGTVASASSAPLCFDPNAKHLVAPGVGLFDSWGSLLPSNWSSVAPPLGECAVDGSKHVYIGGPASTIRKFDLTGNLLNSYIVAATDSAPTANLDLAADECTIYYHGDPGMSGINRFNVCTNTQEPVFTRFGALLDQLRIRPNGQVVQVEDSAYFLFDPSGNLIPHAGNFGQIANALRVLSLDPDGTSFWIANLTNFGSSPNIARVDIASGQTLTQWPAPDQPHGASGLAAYSPPLLGNADIEKNVDSTSAGTAEAFPTRVSYSGQMTSLNLYVDSGSTASEVVLGIYSDKNGSPGNLRDHATITNVAAGSRNYVPIPSMSVTSGQRLWIAVLGPSGTGRIRFRDALDGTGSETSAQHGLTALPAKWSTGNTWATVKLSAYGN